MSSINIHRFLALIHFSGMIIQPWLGYQTSVAGIEGRFKDRKNYLNLHKQIGTITLTSYLLSFLMTLIP